VTAAAVAGATIGASSEASAAPPAAIAAAATAGTPADSAVGAAGVTATSAAQSTDAAAPSAVRAPLPATPVEQIKVQLAKSALSGNDTITVNLHPDDLGRVEIKLELQDGQLRATITANNPDTLQLLKNDAANLQQSLQNAGLSTDANALNFQLRGDQQGQQLAQGQGQGQGNGSGQGYANQAASDAGGDDTLASVAAAVSSAAAANGGLDISV
jgi:flagellar hook-length control protein FliK